MGLSYILQFSHLLQLSRSRIVEFPLQIAKQLKSRKTHLQNVDAQVVIQQCCYHCLVKSLEVTILSFGLLISSGKLLEEVVPEVNK